MNLSKILSYEQTVIVQFYRLHDHITTISNRNVSHVHQDKSHYQEDIKMMNFPSYGLLISSRRSLTHSERYATSTCCRPPILRCDSVSLKGPELNSITKTTEELFWGRFGLIHRNRKNSHFKELLNFYSTFINMNY